jgi:hypothetical protein
MKIKLNFKAGKPTVNGHIYPKEVLEKAFDKRLSDGHFFVQQYKSGNNFYCELKNVFAEVESYEIEPNSEILVDIRLLDVPVAEKFKDGKFELTISGVGIFEDDKKTISEDFKISHLFVVGGNESE